VAFDVIINYSAAMLTFIGFFFIAGIITPSYFINKYTALFPLLHLISPTLARVSIGWSAAHFTPPDR
jgi:hypothetical protein